MRPLRTVVLSRTDSIGDVMLTLPMAGLLRRHMPGLRIVFLGRRYTEPMLRRCTHVDEVMTLEDLLAKGEGEAVMRLKALQADAFIHVFPNRQVAALARRAGISMWVGTAHRWWHWTTCDERVAFSRRRSDLHEAQLNLKLLGPLGIMERPGIQDLAALTGFVVPAPDEAVKAMLFQDRIRVVVHPLSKGSAVEWGLDHFGMLMRALDPERYQVLVTGTEAEAVQYRSVLPLDLPHVTDAGGRLTLEQLIALIGASHALVAASTGPLHVAAASGIRAVGLYAAKRPIHPGRWGPLGDRTRVLLPQGMEPDADPQIQVRAITVDQVLEALSGL